MCVRVRACVCVCVCVRACVCVCINNIIASEASLLHELAGAFLWYIYIYIYLYPWADHLVPRGPPVTRNAQMSDRPVEVQWSI